MPGFVAYNDSGQNCPVLHDKEWVAVDNTNGPHKGREYVTWTRFLFAERGLQGVADPPRVVIRQRQDLHRSGRGERSVLLAVPTADRQPRPL
jgi:hypothetical protein